MNIAPLVWIRVNGRQAGELPAEWIRALEEFGLDEGTLIDFAMSNPVLSPLFREPFSLDGRLGLVDGVQVPNDSEAMKQLPRHGWWPEIIQVSDGSLAYPADADPTLVVAFFAPIATPNVGDRRAVALARFSVPVAPVAPPQIWLSPDGNCGYSLNDDVGGPSFNCLTAACAQPCVGTTMAMDGARTAFVCRCPSC